MSTDFIVVGNGRPILDQISEKLIGTNLKISKSDDGENININDGTNYLWLYFDEKGKLNGAAKYGLGNYVDPLIVFLENNFKVRFVSEHDDEYWKILDKEVENELEEDK